MIYRCCPNIFFINRITVEDRPHGQAGTLLKQIELSGDTPGILGGAVVAALWWGRCGGAQGGNVSGAGDMSRESEERR